MEIYTEVENVFCFVCGCVRVYYVRSMNAKQQSNENLKVRKRLKIGIEGESEIETKKYK